MNTAMKLLMGNGWIKMDEAMPEEQGGSGGSDATDGGDDLSWLLDDDEPEVEEPEGDDVESGDDEGDDTGDEEEPEVEGEDEPEGDEPEEEESEETEPEKKPKKKKSDKKDEDEEEEQPEEQTPEQQEQDQAARKEAFRTELEERFAISEEDANLLISEPEKVMPKLMSQIAVETLDMVQQMQTQMLQAMPQIIQGVNQQQTTEADARTQFMEMHPGLETMDAETLDAAVTSMAPVLKQQFPNATPQELMQKLGTAIATLHGVKTPAKKQQKKAPPKPHTPTAPAQSSTPPAQKQLSNLEQQIEELLNDDD